MSPPEWPKSPGAWVSTTWPTSTWAATSPQCWDRYRENGSIAYYATNGALEPKVNLRVLMAKNLTVRGFVLPTSPHAARKRAQSDITAFVRTSGRVLSVASTFPLHETAAAHLSVEAGQKVGTVVVACTR